MITSVFNPGMYKPIFFIPITDSDIAAAQSEPFIWIAMHE